MPQSKTKTLTDTTRYAANFRKRPLFDDLRGDNLNNTGVGRILELPMSAVNAGVIEHRETPMQSHF